MLTVFVLIDGRQQSAGTRSAPTFLRFAALRAPARRHRRALGSSDDASAHIPNPTALTDLAGKFTRGRPSTRFAVSGLGITVVGASNVLTLSTFAAVSLSADTRHLQRTQRCHYIVADAGIGNGRLGPHPYAAIDTVPQMLGKLREQVPVLIVAPAARSRRVRQRARQTRRSSTRPKGSRRRQRSIEACRVQPHDEGRPDGTAGAANRCRGAEGKRESASSQDYGRVSGFSGFLSAIDLRINTRRLVRSTARCCGVWPDLAPLPVIESM